MMIVLRYLSCLHITINIIVTLSSWLRPQSVEAGDSFPNITQHLMGKDRFRLYYELHWFDKNNQSMINSKLVDEAYSFGLNSGRLLVNNGVAPKKPMEFNIFYWILGKKFQESFWLRPFICQSDRKEASEAPTESGLLFEQYCLYEMLTFKATQKSNGDGRFVLQGLAALLANTLEKHANDLSMVIGHPQEQASGLSRWWLDTKLGYWLEFNFQKWDPQEELSFEHLVGSRIVIFKSVVRDCDREPGPMVAQLTVLKASYYFPDSLVRLPRGYSCRHIGTLNPPPVALKNSPLNVGPLTKYILEISTTTTSSANGSSQPQEVADGEPLSSMPPEPIDTMTAPTSNSSFMVMVVDREDNSLSVVTRFASQASRREQASLNFWDLNIRRHYKLTGFSNGGSCDEPMEFKSSLQLVGAMASSKPEHEANAESGCLPDFESIVVNLSENLGLRLTKHGLRWLTFELQDRASSGHLVDFSEIPSSPGDYEFNYEAPARNLNLCLFYLDSGKPLELDSTKLMTTYEYSMKLDRWSPKTSSLQFFDTGLTKLTLKIDLKLSHQSPYDPWTSQSHLIDLRACKSGHRQSAKVLIEYPLSNSNRLLLNKIKDPYHTIRSAIYAHLKSKYFLTLARVPSMSVSIHEDNLISVQVHLLEQIHLLHDSELLGAVNVSTSGKYMDWLRSATRSILVSGRQSCAEYCQSYRCEVYVYCTYSISCYIYLPAALNQPSQLIEPGSYTGLFMSCSAFRVAPGRSDSVGPAISKSLEEILESIHQAVDDQIESNSTSSASRQDPMEQQKLLMPQPTKPIILVTPSLKVSGSRSSEILRLIPSYAHYQFDKPNKSPALSRIPNPFKINSDPGNPVQREEGEVSMSANFRVALGGHRLFERGDLKVVKHHVQLENLDLQDTDGYLSLMGVTLDDCLRLCLTQTDCASVSYCPLASHCLTSLLNQTGLDYLDQIATNHSVGHPVDPVGNLFSRIELQEDPSCTIMTRTYSDQFERLELRMLFTYSRQSLDDVIAVVAADNPEDCATKCVLSRMAGNLATASSDDLATAAALTTCRSYDYCRSDIKLIYSNPEPMKSGCILYNRHLVSKSKHLDVIKGDHGPGLGAKESQTISPKQKDLYEVLTKSTGVDSGGYCWHYVRNFLTDFHKINGRRLSDEMRGLVLRNYREEGNQTTNKPEVHSPQADPTYSDTPDLSTMNLDLDSDDSSYEDISLARCAQLCEEDPNCGAFEYCAMSNRDAPGGLYLGCSLGSNETLAMIPVNGGGGADGTRKSAGHQPPKRYVRDMVKLARYKYCSVYIYKALSLIIGHKKKNLRQLAKEIIQDIPDEMEDCKLQDGSFWFQTWLVVLFSLFFLFGLTVRDLDLSQFSFHRLQDSHVFGGNMVRSMRSSTSLGNALITKLRPGKRQVTVPVVELSRIDLTELETIQEGS